MRRLSRELSEAGREDAMTHAEARPPVTETEAVGRALELALATGARTHLCHLTLERSFTLVARARADGADATAETCTHYLLLDERELARQGARAKINPPLRPADQVEALWRLVASGGVHHVTSDHVGWLPERKQTGSIWSARSGAPGLELTLPLLYSEGVATRGLPAGAPARGAVRAPRPPLRAVAAQGRDRAGRRRRPRGARPGGALARRRGAGW